MRLKVKTRKQAMPVKQPCAFKEWGRDIDHANTRFARKDYTSALSQYEDCLQQAIKNFEGNACYDPIASITTIVVTQKNISSTCAMVGKYELASAYYAATLAFIDNAINTLRWSSTVCHTACLIKQETLTEWTGFITKNKSRLTDPAKQYIEFAPHKENVSQDKYYH